ncbi:MAG: sulfite exporter TauE/SafE family protein [Chloroflexota bacterium]|nr:sulfite exporter TauE/SafE family protein [Chloroflexota bacterium]
MTEELLIGAGVVAAAFGAAVVGGVVGIGTAIIMLPILALVLGVRETVAVLAVAMTMANLARMIANRREIDWRVVVWWTLGALPFAILGTFILASAPPEALTRLLGAFFLLVVVYRRMPLGQDWHMPVRGFAVLGAVQAGVTALFGAAGPLGVPFFLAYGLTRGAFVGTMSAGNVAMNGVRIPAQSGFDLLTLELALIGVGIGLVMFAGGFAGRWVVTRVSERFFIILVEVVLAAVGLLFLIRG